MLQHIDGQIVIALRIDVGELHPARRAREITPAQSRRQQNDTYRRHKPRQIAHDVSYTAVSYQRSAKADR